MSIPVLDIFAGPGGLSEGFSSVLENDGKKIFKIFLSVEKDDYAHQTLMLRSFFRQFSPNSVPDEYYEFLRGKIDIDALFDLWPIQGAEAKKEAIQFELNRDPDKMIDQKISEGIKDSKFWVLVGGPPCQAYSVIGRSRTKGINMSDSRLYLYLQYLRILAVHSPSVFVMENVEGLVSASTKDGRLFDIIRSGLMDPARALSETSDIIIPKLNYPRYNIYSLTKKPSHYLRDGTPEFADKDFVVKCDEYGIPQRRKRVLLIGVRKDIDVKPKVLIPCKAVPVKNVLFGLPRLRSGISKRVNDNSRYWKNHIINISTNGELEGLDSTVVDSINSILEKINIPRKERGSEFLQCSPKIKYLPKWYLDVNIGGVCNHSVRGHMEKDLHRYLFVSSFAKVKKRSPMLADFPIHLLPNHKNIKENKFVDRFKTLLRDKPAQTITSHISKDGHYYIHYDPTQCRSITVREAARIQTFPDNYFFCGPRTAQYTQVGNAVPPILSWQIAEIVLDMYKKIGLSK